MRRFRVRMRIVLYSTLWPSIVGHRDPSRPQPGMETSSIRTLPCPWDDRLRSRIDARDSPMPRDCDEHRT